MLCTHNSRQYFAQCALLPQAMGRIQLNFIFCGTHSKIFLMNMGSDFITQNCSLVAITMLTHPAYRNDPSYLSTSWIISTVCNYLYIA